MSLNNHGLGFALSANRPVDPCRHLGSLGPFLRMQEGLQRTVDMHRQLLGPALDMHRAIERITPSTLGVMGPALEMHRMAKRIAGVGTLANVAAMPSHLDLFAQAVRPFEPPPFPSIMLSPLSHQFQFDQISKLVERIAGPFFEIERGFRERRRRLCSRKLAAVESGDIEALKLFTTEVLELPPDRWAAVGVVLYEQRWLREAVDNPIAYIRESAERTYWKGRGPKKSACIYRNLIREGLPEDLDGVGLQDPRWEQPFRLVELQRDYGIEDLTTEELILAEVRMSGVTRDAAPDALGWTKKRVARVWQRLNRRRRQRLCKK